MVALNERQLGFWGCLGVVERRELTGEGRPFAFPAGSTLIGQRDVSGDVIVLRSGFAKVVTRVDAARRVMLALRGPGDIVGEMASVDGGQRSASVVAVGDGAGIIIPGPAFQDLLARSPHASNVLTRTLVDRLREADRDRLAVAAMSVRQRLARLFLKLAARYGARTADGIVIGLLSQKDFAACIGGAQRSVAREIGMWRNERIISTGRRWVTIHRPSELHRMVTLSQVRSPSSGGSSSS